MPFARLGPGHKRAIDRLGFARLGPDPNGQFTGEASVKMTVWDLFTGGFPGAELVSSEFTPPSVLQVCELRFCSQPSRLPQHFEVIDRLDNLRQTVIARLSSSPKRSMTDWNHRNPNGQ